MKEKATRTTVGKTVNEIYYKARCELALAYIQKQFKNTKFELFNQLDEYGVVADNNFSTNKFMICNSWEELSTILNDFQDFCTLAKIDWLIGRDIEAEKQYIANDIFVVKEAQKNIENGDTQ